MKKQKTSNLYECQHCGWQSSKWVGKCPNCASWESLVELKKEQVNYLMLDSKKAGLNTNIATKAIPITQIQEEILDRFSSTQNELDIVLGGGIVYGGLYLIGGSPGVGKSTLLLKVAGGLAQDSYNIKEQDFIDNGDLHIVQKPQTYSPKRVLYVSGEESLSQIRNRASRCNAISPNLYLLSEINIEEIKESLLNGRFEVCIIDSIQTLYSPNLNAAPGSVSQVREITFELMRMAKNLNIAMFIIGHITKDGQIAGPRVLEHMVDCVLYFEGERNNELKILRGFKNRFGATSEIGIFEMRADGLVSATEATKKFFSAKKDMPGSAAVAIMEGSRCLVVEIQALTCENEFGMSKRLSNGFDSNRLNMLLALLEKKLGIHLHRHDVFINVAGGIKINEPSADLAVIASILSSYKNRPLKASTAFLGEVSLIGDIREVGGLDMRLKELESFGFKNVIVPNIPKNYKGNLKCIAVDEVAKIIDWM
ncbi:DNA repair protein RadA [Helicobacter didelphidarum]|uniref:DNA repair protein RadA n=1 Tax=Helicobacter didelphidarum TaxID=2040648 RepID=A0A3D8IFP4_9HELI|nr:DNA repair protein RadA [Helicobacter didelphidarum]RDU64057.1 DNA repair protein RadA [Helicobacter didelphidarum]